MNQKTTGQKFFYLTPIRNDGLGLTPEFAVEGKNPFHDYSSSSEKDYLITDLKQQLILINGPFQEGKARLLEMPRFITHSLHPVILISENVKKILQHFNLPEHRFDLIKLKPKKIKTNNQFYLFQLNRDTLSQEMDYKTTTFLYGIKELLKEEVTKWKPVKTTITDYTSFQECIGQLNKTVDKKPLAAVHVKPETFNLKTNYDIYSYSVHNKILVTEFLKKELERLLPNQIEFKPADDLNIKMDAKAYARMAGRHFNITVTPIKYISSAKDAFYLAKKERLEKTKIKIPSGLHKKDGFTAIEKKLRVIFPEKFKKYFNKGPINEKYTLLPVSDFYIQNDFAERQPETYQAIIFAENGHGDSLGLLLEEKSDFKLQSQIFEFLHESGEVIKL